MAIKITKKTDLSSMTRYRKKPVDDYLKNTSRKQIFKDVWFYLAVLSWFYFMFWVMGHVHDLTVPRVTDLNGVTVTGNCSFIYDMYNKLNNQRNGQLYLEEEDMPLINGTFQFKLKNYTPYNQ